MCVMPMLMSMCYIPAIPVNTYFFHCVAKCKSTLKLEGTRNDDGGYCHLMEDAGVAKVHYSIILTNKDT